MEEDIEKLKQNIEELIKKYKLKTLKINTAIEYHSRFNTDNPKKWITEYYSKVNKIDVNLTK